ncbi:hypothetical protein EV138_1082 [Kribbella voronezhensis]|uniref:Uncharacterized protein n=1 Tax=Kribbella voronezhensis TaxID=2512212 RepID=A0A4R7T8N4_9ACTN|nr:hypothetical protein [Kribbella voronezhensis]TDU87558.1 hypothetical protein EV138_1082 [Kribbella voronezhensis]
MNDNKDTRSGKTLGDIRIGDLSPELQKRLADAIRAAQPQLNEVNRVIAARIAPQVEGIVRAAAANIPKVLPNFVLPPLKIDYETLFPNLAEFNETLLSGLKPALEATHLLQREQFGKIFEQLRRVAERILPPNWHGANGLSVDLLETLLLDEGLPLAWVPPKAVLEKVFAAPTPAQRRNVIGRNWKIIGESCVQVLDSIEDPSLGEHVQFARLSAVSLLGGSPAPSQALSANLLDSVLRAEFSSPARKTVTSQKTRLDMEDYPIRVAIVLGAVWAAHGEYWPDKGHKIPHTFSRHASAHGVSRRQYTKINATLSLMHVTSLLKMLDVDTPR